MQYKGCTVSDEVLSDVDPFELVSSDEALRLAPLRKFPLATAVAAAVPRNLPYVARAAAAAAAAVAKGSV